MHNSQSTPTKYRASPQIKTTTMSSTHAYTVNDAEPGGVFLQNSSANDLEEDDDICPVCESECTCANRSRSAPSIPTLDYQTPYFANDVFSSPSTPASSSKTPNGRHSTSTSTALPLKIKLTINNNNSNGKSPYSGDSRGPSGPSLPSKKKSKNHPNASHGRGSGSTSVSVTSVSPGPVGGSSMRLNADGSVPKKRGRPTKAVVAAREAAKLATVARLRDVATDQSINNVGFTRHSKSLASRKATHVKTSPIYSQKKGKKLHGAAAASRARALQRKALEKQKKRRISKADNDLSSLSELTDEEDSDVLDQYDLPTFVSAFSSSSDSSGSETESDSEKEIPQIPHPQESPLLLLNNDSLLQRRRGNPPEWDSRVRRKDIKGDTKSDDGMDTDGEGEDEDEDEDEDEEEDEDDEDDEDANGPGVQRLMRYAGVATGWTDDEEESESFDADIFFATLSDSTAEGTDDEQMGDAEVGFGEDDGPDEDDQMDVMRRGFNGSGFDLMRLSEVAAAGFLAPFADLDTSNLPFGQGWDHLLLSNNLRDSVLEFERVQSHRDSQFNTNLVASIPGYEDADAMMATSEEEEAVAMFDNDSQDLELDGVEIFEEDSDCGDTTEDEFVDIDGVVTPRRSVLLRFPASLGAVDPMSTLSSPVRAPSGRSTTLETKNKEPRRPVPKPSDILSGKVSTGTTVDGMNVELPNSGSSAPLMGSFTLQKTDNSKSVVITSPGNTSSGSVIPCPYPIIRRLRQRGKSLSALSHSGSDHSTRSRHSSFIGSTRPPLETSPPLDFTIKTSGQASETKEPIKLDDVINTALLGSDASDMVPVPESTASELGETGESDSERDRHLEALRRWEFIPMDAFRRSRAAGAANQIPTMGAITKWSSNVNILSCSLGRSFHR